MTQALSIPDRIKALRETLGLSGDEFARRIGLSSRSRVSEIERGSPISLNVALAIEALSGGEIDAGEMCADVAAARAAQMAAKVAA